MRAEISGNKEENIEKVLVCITAQSNSHRLIDRAADEADELGAELHVLHVLKGSSVFNNEETARLLEQLFAYAGEKGGMIHSYCEENISGNISDFVNNEKISCVVLGEPPAPPPKRAKKANKGYFQRIVDSLPKGVRVVVVKRELRRE